MLQESGQFLVPVQVQQPRGQGVAEPLVVAGVEPEHVEQVPGGLLPPTHGPEGVGQALTGSHVGAGLQEAPEVARILPEGLGANGPFPGGDGLLVKFQPLLGGFRLLGKQNIRVGAVG